MNENLSNFVQEKSIVFSSFEISVPSLPFSYSNDPSTLLIRYFYYADLENLDEAHFGSKVEKSFYFNLKLILFI